MIHFNIKELCASLIAKSHNIDNTPTPQIEANIEALIVNVLDPVRAIYGKPIRVNSGYRSPALNQAVKGAATSQHLSGEAADIDTGSKAGNRWVFEFIRDNLIFDQLINEHDFIWIHVSFRKSRNRKQLLEIR